MGARGSSDFDTVGQVVRGEGIELLSLAMALDLWVVGVR